MEVSPFSGRMGPQVFAKGGKRVRYDGVQATKTCAQSTVLIQAAWATVKGLVQGAIQRSATKTSRPRYEPSSGRDPLICPHGQRAMGVWRIWHPTSGVIPEALEAMRRGKYASKAPRADPAGRPGRPLWSTS